MGMDAPDVKSECDTKIAPFKGVLWLVERGASCMKIGPFEAYFGWSAERAPTCLYCHMHARKRKDGHRRP